MQTRKFFGLSTLRVLVFGAGVLGAQAVYAQGIEMDDKPPAEGEIEMDDQGPAPDLAADQAAADASGQAPVQSNLQAATKPVSWSDIVTVIRKPFLKLQRIELLPFLSTTMNDNMIRHYGLGAQINYFLTDVLAIGLEGQLFARAFREPYDLVPRQAKRIPSLNEYNFAASLNFHYVPIYGKFAVLDKKILAWESYFTAGIGITQSAVLPRDPGNYKGFTNYLITPNVGAAMRFFLFKWLTIDFGVRDYIFVDKYEPINRMPGVNETAADAKANASSALINNVMFQVGVSFWIPPTFEYTTFR